MSKSARISYVIMAVLLVLIGWLHMATLVLTAMFGFFALNLLSFGRSKVLAVTLYLVAVVLIGWGLVFFSKRAYVTLPQIAERTIPAVVGFAEKKGIELPFTDYQSLKTLAVAEVKDRVANIGRYARETTLQIAMLIIGLVVALSLFINAKWNVEDDPDVVKDSLYSTVARELVLRFEMFYRSFAKVIGAQIIISTINTSLTAIFLAWNGFPFTTVIIVLTFLFGLLPIIGNLLSNTLIVGVAFTISPRMALTSLIFLVVIHKLEYFLNSKVIGDRIKNPMWLTLIGLVLGEKLMGIPGMILAPVVLHYIKVEASRNKAVENAGGSRAVTMTVSEHLHMKAASGDSPQKKRAPTLYVIIAIKLLKGIALVLLAAGVYRLSDNNLPDAFQQLLKVLHVDPEKKFFADLAEQADKITPQGMMKLAWGTVLYSLFSLVEGVGLIFRVSWAGWLAIGESGFFVPIEVYELVHRPSGIILAILGLNVFIVWYLLQNRHRLFRHHHH